MNYVLLLAAVPFAAFAAATLVFDGLAWLVWPVGQRALAARAAGPGAYLALRAAPAALSLAAAFSTVLVYLEREPRGTSEMPGYAVCGLALLGGAVFVAGALRVLRRAIATAGWVRLVRRGARPLVTEARVPAWEVDTDEPLVAVVGIMRPHLVVASTVRRACPEPELRAVIRHEMAHLARRDNLALALVDGLPDLLHWSKRGRALVAGWHDAVECAADRLATVGDRSGRTALASALLRIAQVPRGASWAVTASPLVRPGGLELRVRRLLSESDRVSPEARRVSAWLATAIVVVGSVVALQFGGDAIQQVIEAAVNLLP